MKPCLAPIALGLMIALPAQAQTTISDRLAADGLRAVEADLAALPSPDASDRFALGGVRFLGGVERALQLRYRVGLSEGMAVMSGLPILRLPIAENPAPEAFEPAMIEALFEEVETDMAGSIDALGGIADDDAVAVTIDTRDLWFDIDSNGARSTGEGVLEVAGVTLGDGSGESPKFVTIRFDTADVAWLTAYAHLLSAVSEGVLAVEPTEAIARVIDARTAFAAFPPSSDPYSMGLDDEFGQMVDLAAMAIEAIEGQPDPIRTRSLRDHLLAMVQENRRFWMLVAREDDNEAEWIPAKDQVSATGLPFPPDTGARWLAVLADAEAVLNGERLIPFWRMGDGAGIDLAALLENPPVIDIVGMIQGATLLPYAREGVLADGRNLTLFSNLVAGDAAFYAVVLN